MYTQKNGFPTIIMLTVCLFAAAAEDRTATLGGEAGWPPLSFSTGLESGKGRLGREALVLSTGLPADTAPEELYVPFDDKSAADRAGNYDIISSSLQYAASAKARRGNGAGLFNTDGAGLVMRGRAGSLFSNPGKSGSFTLEFWLFPAVTENGSVLFQWRSSRNAPAGALYQYIRSSLFRNHIEWAFSNIWTTVGGKPLDVTISGVRNLIPGQWSHHRLSWDESTGMLEYLLDGSTEAIRYMTSTGRERGDVYPAVFGTASDIEIGSRFSGLIDEFRILRNPAGPLTLAEKHAVLERYPAPGGRFESMPVDSGNLNSSLKRISVVQSVPAETGTAFFVRSADSPYAFTADSPAWIPAEPDRPLDGITGRYFQIAGELYPDGRGTQSPVLTSVTLHYAEDTPPWPPARVTAAAGNNSVALSWVRSIDQDAAGYLVYYGDRPGEYLGAGSPIDAGNNLSFTVNGLANGKLYFFSIAVYDASGVRYPGTLSGEVYARPQAGR